MKYQVKVGERIFEVELSNIHSQPIIALVEGEAIEVWLEDARDLRPSRPPKLEQRLPVGASAQQSLQAPAPKSRNSPAGESSQNAVRFPIPGVVVSLSVREGDEVDLGQELCVLEAMKMKNVIRASRRGKVASVRAVVGQAVKHNEILMEFTE